MGSEAAAASRARAARDWLGIVAAVGFGLVALLKAAETGFLTSVWLAYAARTDGVVTQVGTGSGRHGAPAVTVRFTMQGGEEAEATWQGGIPWPSWQAGERVPLAYLPGQADTARPATFWALWAYPVLLGALGVLLTGTGVALIVRRLRRRR